MEDLSETEVAAVIAARMARSQRKPRAGHERKYLTEAELASLLKIITNIRDKAIFTVAYWRGLRACEVGKLPYSAFDQRAGRLHVKRVKRSLEGSFPLSPAELKALRGWLKVRGEAAGPLFTSRQGKRGITRAMLHVLMRRYGAAAGLPAGLRHFHALKHSIGTHLLGKLDIMQVRHWLGHRDIKSTMVYSQLRSQEMDKAAARVYEGS